MDKPVDDRHFLDALRRSENTGMSQGIHVHVQCTTPQMLPAKNKKQRGALQI